MTNVPNMLIALKLLIRYRHTASLRARICRDCLTKPFALEELTTVVERADVALHFDRESRLLRERLRA